MTGLSPALTAFLAALLVQLTLTIPVAFVLIRTYLKSKQNEIEITKLPTHAEVAAKVDARVKDILSSNSDSNHTM